MAQLETEILSHVGSGTEEATRTHSAGDIGWTLICSAMVWLMVPGVGFFYSGLARSKSALSLVSLCLWSIAVVSIQWFLFGYSLTFCKRGSFFIGSLNNALLLNVLTDENPTNVKVPEILFCIYQGMIAGITPALVVGATAERGRFLPTLVFMFLWTTLVYDFIAHWTWDLQGWSHHIGVLDFAGGTPVHVASGAAALVYAYMLGEREGSLAEYKPHNIVQVVLGTSLIWFGWFGFNGGSALGANARAAVVIVVTNLSASTGGIVWSLLDYRKERKFSALSFCFGAVTGLVTVTPASGYIHPYGGIIFGAVGAVACRFAIQLKVTLGYDDALDVVAVHGVGGIIGTLLTGIFASKEIANLDGGTLIAGGWVDGNWIQLGLQAAAVAAAAAWSLVGTFLILVLMNTIPTLWLRVDEGTEKMGIDKAEIGESAYQELKNPT